MSTTMTVQQLNAFLADHRLVANTYSNGGWRVDCLSRYRLLYEATVADGPAAIADAFAEPDGWAFRLQAWCNSERSDPSAPGGWNPLWPYPSKTAAAIDYMLKDLRQLLREADYPLFSPPG
jgi:hypothetical protein